MAEALRTMDETAVAIMQQHVAATNSISPEARQGLGEAVSRLKKGQAFYVKEALELIAEPIEDVNRDLRAAGISNQQMKEFVARIKSTISNSKNKK